MSTDNIVRPRVIAERPAALRQIEGRLKKEWDREARLAPPPVTYTDMMTAVAALTPQELGYLHRLAQGLLALREQ